MKRQTSNKPHIHINFLWCIGVEGCPPDLVLKSGGSITFDSRSGVSSVVKFGFGLLWFLSMDRRSRGGGS